MREEGTGRGALSPWGDAPSPFQRRDTVYSGDSRGTVVSVDAAGGTMGVIWDDGDGGAITYPLDATYIRKPFPWE